jgi:hypothetical protein
MFPCSKMSDRGLYMGFGGQILARKPPKMREK